MKPVLRIDRSRTRAGVAHARAGVTLVEVLVTTLVMAIVLGAAGMTMVQSGQAFEHGSAAAAMDIKARRALERLVREVTAAQAGSLAPVPNVPGVAEEALTFDRSIGIGVTQTLAFGFRYEAGEADDGLDNDGDGLIDEGQLFLTQDLGAPEERTLVLCSFVRESLAGEIPGNLVDDNGNGLVDEGGVALSLDGDVLTIRLTLERLDPDNNLMSRTVESGIRLRN